MIKEVLYSAADKVDHGWVQGQGRFNDRVCMVVAISDSLDEFCPGNNEEAYANIRDYLMERLNTDGLAHWNDTLGRTRTEVSSTLRQAADEAVIAL